MRTIKFRAWDEDRKRMIYEFADSGWGKKYRLIHDEEGGKMLCGNYKNNGDWQEPILMQYVGLKDKNGTEIFENDILSLDGKFTYEVRFEDAKFVLYHVKGNALMGTKWGDLHRAFDSDFAQYSFMVIGDIYRNPELLKR